MKAEIISEWIISAFISDILNETEFSGSLETLVNTASNPVGYQCLLSRLTDLLI